MRKSDECKTSRTRFSDFNNDQWKIMVAQVIQNYGYAVLGDDFDFEPVPENRRFWVEQFRIECSRRRKKLLGK